MVDVLSEVGKTLDIQFEYEYKLPWTWAKHRVEQGEIDVLAGAFFTVERAKRFVYSTQVLKGYVHIFTKKARNLNIQSLSDLSDLHGLRPLGGSYGDSFDSYANKHLNLTEVTPKETMLKMLLHDRADYLVLLERDGKEQLVNPEYAEAIQMHDNPKIPIDIFLMFGKSSPCLLRIEQINGVINQLKQTGQLQHYELNYALPL